jgi:septal ring factor EnvC (AmiA/AmiB activator)
MKRLVIVLFLMVFALAPYAQQKRRVKPAARKTAVATKKKATKKKPSAQQPANSVQSLQKQRQQIQKKIKEQERLLVTKENDVRKRLQNLMLINSEIEGKRRTIDTIRRDISSLDVEIEMLLTQLDMLQEQLDGNKQNYVKSMRYMHRNHSLQSQLMFVFSAENLTQMYRRLRFMREYASYQRVQGERVKSKQEEVNRKFQEISVAQSRKRDLLTRDVAEQRQLENKQTEQKNVVSTLQKEQKTIQNVIAQQKKKDAALNEQIDRLIAEEVARKKAREAAERQRARADRAYMAELNLTTQDFINLKWIQTISEKQGANIDVMVGPATSMWNVRR